MALLDMLKKDKGSDILKSAVESAIEKALAELDCDITSAESLADELDATNVSRETSDATNVSRETSTDMNDVSERVRKLTQDINTMRADIQKAVLASRSSNAEVELDPDKALASILGLTKEKNANSPTLD